MEPDLQRQIASARESTGGKGMDPPPTHPWNQISPKAKWKWLISESENTQERVSGFILSAGFRCAMRLAWRAGERAIKRTIF